MAVTIEKKFWNGAETKDIVKIVFTSPNFTSPATAGTRSHIQPGGQYIGTWYEAVDFLYRQQPNQDYIDYSTHQESFFGEMTVSGSFDFSSDTTVQVWHNYGADYDVVGPGTYDNILYYDKDNYGTIDSVVSGIANIPGVGTVQTLDITFDSVTGDKVANEWMTSTTSGLVYSTVSGTGASNGATVTSTINTTVTAIGNDSNNTMVSGIVVGEITGIVSGTGTVTGTLIGTVSGTLTNTLEDGKKTFVSSAVTGTMSVDVAGPEDGTVTGTVSGIVDGPLKAPHEFMFHQYSNVDIDDSQTTPRLRRHVGGNSVIFEVTFGEAYNCRLTAWDDDNHNTTNNKILDEEHYRVDVATCRVNSSAGVDTSKFLTNRCLVYPPGYDIPLKGNEKYYGDFDLIFVIEADEYGEYLVFLPRLVDMDNTFTAGSYDFVTTLHYEYT